MSAWLQRQRKSGLVALAESIGLDSEGMKKVELESALDYHLRAHRARLIHFPETSQYYSLASNHSPAKRETVNTFLSESIKNTRTRGRPSVVAVDAQKDGTSSGSESIEPVGPLAQSPRSPSIYESAMPASPKVVADSIEQSTAIIREQLSNIWDRRVTETAHYIRDRVSTMFAVEIIVLSFETAGLLHKLVPLKYALTIPSLTAGGIQTPSWPVSLPDLFFLLTSSFWYPFSLWILTGLLGPSFFSYFLNLTLRAKNGPNTRPKAGGIEHKFDPLMFNIAKAVIAWIVYSDYNNSDNIFGEHNVSFVKASIPGGYHGILIGASIGVITSIYEAVLDK
ncbi:MAG: hypothetical protein M1829_000784 [Trizodia sp. TS-e1964]|nr:MAG: hypothetical protein M1829_000784 [Trizodia sp. TS-e1964]